MAIQQIDWNAVEKEAVELLSRYIQINTINPPGNELEGARFLKEVLEKNGFAADLYESDKGRGNVFTRFMGDSGAIPEIMLLHHIDVVPVEEDKWQHPPLSGIVFRWRDLGPGSA